MTFRLQRNRARHLRLVPLEAVPPLSGARRNAADQHKWHTSQGVLSVNRAQFMNWHRGVGGGGAIDLAMHLHHLDFQQALDWLDQHFPGPLTPEPTPIKLRPPFQLPPPDPSKLSAVRHYLVAQRRIPGQLITSLIGSHHLYADRQANAVFLLLGKEDQPVGAELRGTTERRWLGLAPGSQKDLGFFSIPAVPRPKIILCESAIDALSCFALYPELRCLSTAGARANPSWLAPLIAQGHELFCGYDADAVGETMARAMIDLYPSTKRLRPSHHDWNAMLTSRS